MLPTQKHHSKIKRFEVMEDEAALQKFLETNFTESLKQMIKVTVKTMIKAEMEHFRQGMEQKLQFNGTYGRNLISSYGQVSAVPIPRFRETVSGMELKTMQLFGEEEEKLMKLVEQMHLLGISQRKIKHLMQNVLGVRISKTRVGEVYRELVEKEELDINRQLVGDDFEYLLLDGIWEITKGYGWENNRSVLLCALGVRSNGERKIIGFRLARNEGAENWRTFLSDLKRRGLKGQQLKLVIIDDTAGIKSALDSYYPTIAVQTCIAHKMRNVIGKTRTKHKRAMADDLKPIFQSESKEQAIRVAKDVVKKWYLQEPAAMASLRFNLETCFSYYAFPRELWSKLRTTNLLEREFREVRRRIRAFDNTFQSEESANRYANSIFSYLNQNYPLKNALHTKS